MSGINRYTVATLLLGLACAAFLAGGCRKAKTSEEPAIQELIHPPDQNGKETIYLPNLKGRETPVISMHLDQIGGFNLPPEGYEKRPVILSVWKNGEMIYSHDWMNGGKPYYSARIPEQQVESFLSELAASELWKGRSFRYYYTGPDSSLQTLVVSYGGKILELGSWNELFEQNEKLVATARGIESLEGRSREAVLAEQPQEYKDFRRLWDQVRNGAKKMIPKEGVETDPNWVWVHWPIPKE